MRLSITNTWALDRAQDNLSDIQRLRAEARDLAGRVRRNAEHQEHEAATALRSGAAGLDDWCDDDIWSAEQAAAAEVLRRSTARAA